MKKLFSLAMIALAASLTVTGCEKKGDKALVTKMEMVGLSKTTYLVDETIDWNSLKVRATFSNKSTKDLTKIEYDVSSVASAETEVVVYTEGLHAQTSLTEGVYHIEAALASELNTKFSLGTINVGEATPDKYQLIEFNEPKMKSAFSANIAGAGTEIEPERNDKAAAKANENKFIGSETTYVVGTMNPFRYNPEIAFLNKESMETVDGEDIYVEKEWSVKVKEAGNYVTAPSNMYEITHDGVQFTEEAVGRVFSLTMSLKGFPEDLNGVNAISTFKDFTVQKGLNIYNAKQLGALNLTHYTTEELNSTKTFSDHTHGYWGGTSAVFYNEAIGEHYSPDLPAVWEKFLKEEHVFTEAEIEAYKDVPAVFLQNKIDIKAEDIPADYFIKHGEFTDNAREGCLRDGLPVYFPIVENNDVEINGNFWMIDAKEIPLCKCNTEKGFHPYVDEHESIFPGHAKLLEFCGLDQENYHENQVDVSNGNKGIVRNLQARGNTGVDLIAEDFEKMLSLTGLIFADNAYCGARYENLIVKEFQIGIFADRMIGHKEEVSEGVYEQVDHTFIANTRVYDCANCGLYNYANGGVHVTKSVFNRFGGAPLLNVGEEEEIRGGNTKFDSSVIFNNEITGEELYFASLGVTTYVTQIKGMGALFTQIGNNFLYEIEDEHGQKYEVMNLVSMFLNGSGYTAADSYDFYSNTVLNYGSANALNAFAMSDPMTAQFEAFDSLGVGMYNQIKEANRPAFYRAAIAQSMSIPAENVPEAMVQQLIMVRDTDPTAMAIEAAYVDYLNNTMHVDAMTAPYNGVHAPICQTEYADELFYINPGQPNPSDAGLYLLANPVEKMTTALNGEYLSILFPVGDTCIGLIFRISKISA